MKLIKYLGSRGARNGRGGLVDIGLYSCPGCGGEIVLPVSVGRKYKRCGCCRVVVHRVPTIYRPKSAERTCLMCGKKFTSRGPHNRRCGLCEKALAGDGQAYYMPPIHKNRDPSTVACCWES